MEGCSMNIGIAGTGGIVKECLVALKEVDTVKCIAICARAKSIAKAQALAKEFNIETIYTNYEKMLMDENIDFIYIGIVNSMHYDYAKQALMAGKHIICEKPLTSTAKETEELITLAKEKNLFFFEAITLIYSPNYQFIKEHLTEIGQVRIIQANFFQYSSRYDKYLAKEVLPAFDPDLSGGALYDINIYNFHMVIGLFGKPNAVNYTANIGFNGIDTSGIALLKYNGFIATCGGAKDSQSQSGMIIQGEKGYMRLNGAPNACATVDLIVGNEAKHYNAERYKHRMANEFIAFHKMYQENNLEKCYQYLDHSAKVMETVYQARKSSGIIFLADI